MQLKHLRSAALMAGLALLVALGSWSLLQGTGDAPVRGGQEVAPGPSEPPIGAFGQLEMEPPADPHGRARVAGAVAARTLLAPEAHDGHSSEIEEAIQEALRQPERPPEAYLEDLRQTEIALEHERDPVVVAQLVEFAAHQREVLEFDGLIDDYAEYRRTVDAGERPPVDNRIPEMDALFEAALQARGPDGPAAVADEMAARIEQGTGAP